MVIEMTTQLGYPATVSFARGLGVLGLSCTALYAIPRTSVLGVILLTGYLGGDGRHALVRRQSNF